jgi:hypothetical protein
MPKVSDTGPLHSTRDKHLFGGGHKRILSLDGGGVRGVIAIAFLERLEQLIEEIEGKPVLLGDWFDLIGGTSTGAVIGTGLALGYRAAEMHEFYRSFAPRILRPSMWRPKGMRAQYDARALMKEYLGVFGTRTLASEDIRTGLCIITKRIDTGSTWILMNNPRSRFWESSADGSLIGNRHYRLVNVVRASTAAPNYFDPEPIEIVQGMKPGLFVDGGVSPHNSPALYLFMVAALPPYGLCWPLGAKNLTVVSVGTGSFRHRIQVDELPLLRTLGVALRALVAQISDAQTLVDILMSWLGNSPTHWVINSELGDLSHVSSPYDQPLFNFLRYDIKLEPDWLSNELGVTLDRRKVESYRRLDAPRNMPFIYELGRLAAERQIRREHLELALSRSA